MEGTAIQGRLVDVLDVVLRVPPLFVMDEFLRIGFGLAEPTFTKVPADLHTMGPLNATDVNLANVHLFHDSIFARPVTSLLCKFLLCCLGFTAAVCMFLLNRKHLLLVYCRLLSTLVVIVSYWSNLHMVRAVLGSRLDFSSSTSWAPASLSEAMTILSPSRLMDSSTVLVPMVANYVLQMSLGVGFGYLRGIGGRGGSRGGVEGGGTALPSRQNQVLDLCVVGSFASPTLAAALPLPTPLLEHAPAFATLIPLLVVKHSLWVAAPSGLRVLHHGYSHARVFVRNFGLHNLLEAEWTRVNVPCVFRTFWLVRMGEQMAGATWAGTMGGNALVAALVRGCETLTAVLGMTSVVSRVCHYIGCALQRLLLVDDEDDRSVGTVSAILFFILALQTGLTTLEPEKRFVRLCRNFCLLFTALLHFVHNMVNPLMMSLSASHNPALHRHVRALSVCLFLLVAPAILLYYLWTHHSANTWLLAVSAFSVEVVVKVLVSLAIYVLFLADAWRATFWEGLDDYVYYIRAFGNTVEFFFGIFLFFNGAWILLFESGGTIRAIMMCIHAYFNIWCEARAGWSVFMKRRTAVNKINSLPEATEEQLHSLDDVCAICYQEMRAAKITRCRHFFHSICLRKWLYVQDRCPLCHEILYKADGEMKADSVHGENGNNMERLLGGPEFG